MNLSCYIEETILITTYTQYGNFTKRDGSAVVDILQALKAKQSFVESFQAPGGLAFREGPGGCLIGGP